MGAQRKRRRSPFPPLSAKRPASLMPMRSRRLSGLSTSDEKSSALPASMRRSVSRTVSQPSCAAAVALKQSSAATQKTFIRPSSEKEKALAEEIIDRIAFDLGERFEDQAKSDV